MRAIRAFVTAALLLEAASFAPGGKAAAALGDASSACALLSSRTVEEATGIPVAEGVPGVNLENITSCSFAGKRGGRVMILVRRGPDGDWMAGEVARMSRGVYREVPGIGKRSFLYIVRGSGAVLCIFETGYYLQVSLLPKGDEPQLAALLTKLAKRVRAALSPSTAVPPGPRFTAPTVY
jgi:hypothetical protein